TEAPGGGGDRIVACDLRVAVLTGQERTVAHPRKVEPERAHGVAQQAPPGRPERRLLDTEDLVEIEREASEGRLQTLGEQSRADVEMETVSGAAVARRVDRFHDPAGGVAVDPFVGPGRLAVTRGPYSLPGLGAA